jgi:acetylornithine deacetylase/succinyl-diaminopimelate desuccinylase-like protein
MKRCTVLVVAAAMLQGVARSQTKTAAQLLAEPATQAAMKSIVAREPHFIDEQIRITEIPAPPFMETTRGLELKRLFTAAGLENVRIDATGNVLGDRPGAAAHPHLVIAAHLDTVFPEGTDVQVKRNGNVLAAPGIGDDGRGLASMLALIDAMQTAKLKTRGTVTFVADVGEEGLGDSRGTKALFATTLKGQIDDFISIDGDRLNGIVNVGVGSYRYKVTFSGPGGHSYGAFGLANPAHALGRTVAHIANIEVPTDPKTTYNVGRIGGGTSVNSIPFEAWFEFDERSPDVKSLDAVDAKFKAAVQAGLDEENAFRHDKGKLSVKLEQLGVRPAGQTPADAPIVKAVEGSLAALGFGEARLGDSSTDSNVPMHLGIPAVTLGGGGKGTGAHSLGETFDPTDSYKGVENLLLTTLLLTQ